MCGIAGTIERDLPCGEVLGDTVRTMVAPLVHRGPNDGGIWTDAKAGISIGHRRLSIRDLSQAGAQPMVSASGRYVLSYNGELYNTAELRASLEANGVSFRGLSDTEVLLEACATWGIERAVQQFIGMFAFALWDRFMNRLWLVRDRIGIKPLYYSATPQRFSFASELSGLKAHPKFDTVIDTEAVETFLMLDYIPAPNSVYRDVRKLEPGAILQLDTSNLAEVDVNCYWTLEEAASNGGANRFKGDFNEATDELERLLTDAIKRRMVSDVPLGVFLSGGIDSSTVVALMQMQSTNAVKTFSIGFEQSRYNEAPYAKKIAKHLGTDHTELYISNDDIRDHGPDILEHHDEPFADPSLIATWFLSHLARNDVTVALTGDGGDELFGGYYRHLAAERCFNHSVWNFNPISKFLFYSLIPNFPKIGRRHLNSLSFMNSNRGGSLSPKEMKVLALGLYDPYQIHHHFSHGDVRLAYRGIRGTKLAINLVNRWLEQTNHLSAAERQQYIDLAGYLPDNILTKVDRASMAVSLEARVPLLDHRIVEFAFRLPPTLKTDSLNTKRILRKILSRHVPISMFDRPKMGFGAPINVWLNGPLKDWSRDAMLNKSASLHHVLRARESTATLSRLSAGRAGRSDFRRVILSAWWKNNV